MEIAEILTAEGVLPSLAAANKRQALEEIAKAASPIAGIPDRAIFDVVLERERLGTTGVGNGIAIPHGKLAGLGRLYAFFARMETPIGFDAIDDRPVDLIFLLLAPSDAGADHLKALARVSRLLRDAELCDQLRGAKDARALYKLLVNGKTSRAA